MKGLSPRTIRNIHVIVSKVFSDAARWDVSRATLLH
jgi:integrase